MAEKLCGWTGKLLRINLSKNKVEKIKLEKNLALSYIGGRGINIKLLYDELKPNTDAFSPSNPLILGAGPCNGTLAPTATRLTITTKSPLTGFVGDGNFGSALGAEIKYAGYDVIIIEGKAKEPSYLWIDDDHVELKPAKHLWGKTTAETEKIIKEELGDPDIPVAAIGPAGENLVKFSVIVSENGGRTAGRGGNGAVMGSKMLKAIAIKGTKGVRVADNSLLEKMTEEIEHSIQESQQLKSFGIYGAAIALFVKINEIGGLITKNYQHGTIGSLANYLSHEMLTKYIVKCTSCFSCPIHCSQFYVVDDGPYAITYGNGFKLVNLQQLGPQIGVKELDFALKLNSICADYGLDVANIGGILGYIMECHEKKVLSATDLGVKPEWGDHEAILKIIEMIVQRKGIGNILAEGLKKASQIIGGGSEKFAMHVKGMAFTSSDPRSAQGWGFAFAVASRGADHMRACVSAERQFPYCHTIERKGELVALFESLRAIEDSLNICKFVSWKYMENVIEAFKERSTEHEEKAIKTYLETELNLYKAVTGVKISPKEFLMVGERIVNLERLFNLREGLTIEDDMLPERFIKEPLPDGKSQGKTVQFYPILNEYYHVRGWDANTGVPLKTKLTELGLQNIWNHEQ
ncbi:MAG: aldehyde ferredoxin oxidoreductase family protein [Candidatus Bathyarchaeia archaeon]